MAWGKKSIDHTGNVHIQKDCQPKWVKLSTAKRDKTVQATYPPPPPPSVHCLETTYMHSAQGLSTGHCAEDSAPARAGNCR